MSPPIMVDKVRSSITFSFLRLDIEGNGPNFQDLPGKY